MTFAPPSGAWQVEGDGAVTSEAARRSERYRRFRIQLADGGDRNRPKRLLPAAA